MNLGGPRAEKVSSGMHPNHDRKPFRINHDHKRSGGECRIFDVFTLVKRARDSERAIVCSAAHVTSAAG